MPVNKIVASKRAKAAIAGVVAAFVASTAVLVSGSGERMPAAVVLAVDTLIKPWEGLVLRSHWDSYAKIWDIATARPKGSTPAW